jgi:hypothetical protein
VAVERLTVSLDEELAASVRDAAQADQMNVSAWLADAARSHLVARGLGDVVSEWERVHGAFTDDELRTARTRLYGS